MHLLVQQKSLSAFENNATSLAAPLVYQFALMVLLRAAALALGRHVTLGIFVSARLSLPQPLGLEHARV